MRNRRASRSSHHPLNTPSPEPADASPGDAAGPPGRSPLDLVRGTRALVALTGAVALTLLAWQTFDWWELEAAESPGARNLTIARLLLVPVLCGALYAAPAVWRRSRRVHRLTFAAWTTYLGLFLLASWPGLIMSDTNDMVFQTQYGRVYEWFSYLHSLLNLMVFDLVPNVAAWGVLQVLGTAAVLSYATGLVVRLPHGRAGAITLNVVAALSAPIIVDTLLYSRDTVFSVLQVFLALYVADVVVNRQTISRRGLVGVALLTGFLSAYRGDGIALALAVPLVLLVLRPARRPLLQGFAAFAGALALFNVALPAAFVVSPEIERNYELSLRINPLGAVLQSEFYSRDKERDLRALGRVIDVPKTVETSSYHDLVPFWAGYWDKQASDADFAAFNDAADRMLRENLAPVLANRMQTFLASSGMAPYQFTGASNQVFAIAGPEGGYGPIDRRYEWIGAKRDGREGRPPFVGLYDAVDSIFARSTGFTGAISARSALQWNFLPALVLLVVVLLLHRRFTLAAAAAAVLLCRVPLVFLAAPAAQFKYYYAVYLGGVIVLGMVVATVPWEKLRRPRWA